MGYISLSVVKKTNQQNTNDCSFYTWHFSCVGADDVTMLISTLQTDRTKFLSSMPCSDWYIHWYPSPLMCLSNSLIPLNVTDSRKHFSP